MTAMTARTIVEVVEVVVIQRVLRGIVSVELSAGVAPIFPSAAAPASVARVATP